MTVKEQCLALLRSVNRPGIENLITYLAAESDYFTAPASTVYHGSYEGGLADHSLAVYHSLLRLKDAFGLTINDESAIVCALLHDFCKVNFYRKSQRSRKNQTTNQWEQVEVFEVDDRFPAGHGEKSVLLLMRFIWLSDEELMAIRWHMGGFDDAAAAYNGSRTLSNAMRRYPLVTALQMADLAASYFDGK